MELVATDVTEWVNQAADLLEMALPPNQLRRVFADLVHQRTPLKGLRTTMVLWLNALLTQQRLLMQGVEEITPLEFSASQLPVPSEQVAMSGTEPLRCGTFLQRTGVRFLSQLFASLNN